MNLVSGKIISIVELFEKGEWDAMKEIREKGQPAHSKRSSGYAYRGSYYLLHGTIGYGEEININANPETNGCNCGK